MLDHKLIIFNHLAKNPNMTKVAETLHLSQPAVSKSIKELENELSITLFDRIKGRYATDDCGEISAASNRRSYSERKGYPV